MSDIRRGKLTNLGAETLTDVQKFKRKLTDMTDSMCYMDWRNSSRFEDKLEVFLQDLGENITDPLTGIELLVAFYEADEDILNQCDDSDGYVGDMFSDYAKELFVEYASLCEDKEKIANIVLKLVSDDNFGVRNSLVDSAGEYLPKTEILTMIATLQKRADAEENDHEKYHHQRLIKSLARQIKDAKLFEKTHATSREELSAAELFDIASVYMESGDMETACSWVIKIPDDQVFESLKRDELLLEIYKKQNNTEKLTDLLYKDFRFSHSTDTLQALLDLVGHDRRDDILADEAKFILANTEFQEWDVEFLISIDKINEAEKYLLKHADHLEADLFESLPPLAQAMEWENRYLAASMIYRTLLISILEEGDTREYPQGVNYLRKLDKLATTISNWKDFSNYEVFKDQIHQDHGRKRSFWSQYRS